MENEIESTNDKYSMFANRLNKVHKHLSKVAKRQQISCYRVYDKDLPEFPLIIDVYNNQVLVTEYKASHNLSENAYEQWLQQSLQVIANTLQVPITNLHLKLRKRKENRTDQYQKTDTQKQYQQVQEGGLQFLINLTDYLDTGLFIDHRITRQLVRNECSGKRVLNLFCYTGAFSVYAAAGCAAEVCSIDLSNTYLDWAKQNMLLNNFDNSTAYTYIKADVLQYLPNLPIHYYDIIVLDPPTFSNSKMMDDFFEIQKDHVHLINNLLTCVVLGGVIYFSTNYTKFVLDATAIKAASIKDITKLTTPFDYEKKLKRYCYLITK